MVVFHPQHANEDVERMLLGNKCDMEDKRVVPKAKGEQVRAQAQERTSPNKYTVIVSKLRAASNIAAISTFLII